jgi:hypothetical protein
MVTWQVRGSVLRPVRRSTRVECDLLQFIIQTLAPGWRIGWVAAGRYHTQVLQAHGRGLGRRTAAEAAASDILAETTSVICGA